MYAAGFLEGGATYELVWDAWNNLNEFMLHNSSQLPPKAKTFVEDQTNWIKEAVELHSNNNFFKLVNSTFAQVRGLYDGYMRKVNESKRSELYLTFDQFYFLTNLGDLQDIIPAFDTSFLYSLLLSLFLYFNRKDMECSGFVKLTQDELIVSHNTFNM